MSDRAGVLRGCFPIALLLLALGGVIGWDFAPVAAGADSGGYLNSARLLADGRLQGELRALPEWPLAQAGPFTYVPLGFIDVQRTGRLTPSYPVGLPLHYALASRLAGWTVGTTVVGVLAALIAIACTYGALREFAVEPLVATLCAATLAFSPMFLFASLVPLSDTVATAWCALAVLAGLCARRHLGYALLAGVAVSVAVLVRPTNILIAPVVALLVWNMRGLVAAAVGGLPGAAFGLWYNHGLYGSALATGYGAVDDLFQRKFLLPALRNYFTTLPNVLTLGVVALALLPFLPWRRRGRDLTALLLWFALFAGFYATYYYTGEFWWYLRFLLPAFPAAIILAGVGLTARLDQWRERGLRITPPLVLAAVILLSLGLSIAWSRQHHVLDFPREQEPHQAVPQWARAHLPANAAVFCFHLSSGFYFYTNFVILRSDQFTPADFARFQASVSKTHRPVYAAIFRFQREEVFRDNLPGPWRKIADVADAEIWQLDTGS